MIDFPVRFSLLLLLIASSSFIKADHGQYGSGDYSYTFTIPLTGDVSFKDSLSQFPDEVFIDELQFVADIFIEKTEQVYLLGFCDKSTVTKAVLENALINLKMKNKFSQALIVVSRNENKTVLLIQLESFWTFNKIIVKGLLRGADKYKHFYVLEFGEPFDKAKHQHSLEKIKENLYSEGLYKAIVSDYLNYDHTTKTIIVTIVIDPGYAFVINDVVLSFSDDVEHFKITPHFEKKINHIFIPKLKDHYYSNALLAEQKNFLKQYCAKKGFLNAKIKVSKEINYDAETVKVTFAIALHVKKAITFFGNHFFSNAELYEIIFSFGRSVGLLPDSFLIQEIVDAYQKKGFWNVEVNNKQEKKRTYFLIKEGVRSVIDAVTFEGVAAAHEKIIKRYFSPFLKNNFDEDLLKLALQKVINFYISQGFLDIKIISQEYIPTKKQSNYKLCITIQEGERRYLKSIVIEQFPELEQCAPFVFSKEKKVPFDINQIQTQRQWLMSYFQQKGYLYADVKHELVYEDDLVTIIWRITGIEKPVKFGKLIVLGSTTYPFENIQRELSFNHGDVWQKEKLEESLKRLRKLRVFETIHLSPHNIAQQEEEKAIILKLLQDEPYEIRIRAGFQQVSKTLFEFRKGTTYKLGGTALYKNPFNAGDCFCIDTDFTRFYRNVSIEYQRPWFFSMPLNTVVKGYSNKYIQPVHIGSDKPLYQAIQQGFLLSVNRCCTHVNFGVNLGLEVMETNKLSLEMARAINFETILVDKKVPYLYTEPDIVINYLDNDVDPNSGSLTVFSCKIMVPVRKVSTTFFKFLFEQSIFFPLSFMASVFGIRFRAGHIFNQDFPNIMPPERFYLGGQNSIRSYDQDFAPPLGSFINEKGKRVLVPQGGKSMFNMNAELRFPLFWNIGGVVFQDIGFLADRSITEVVKSHFLTGTGLGLRYYTPVGPLRFDIGFKWRRHDQEESQYAWFLTLGHAF